MSELKRFRLGLFGVWCNGSTPDSGSGNLGSNPGTPAISQQHIEMWSLRLGAQDGGFSAR